MKKYFLLFIALLPFACFAQFSAGFGLGYDFKSSKALFTMNTAYELEHIKLEGELTPTLSRSVDANNFMGFKIGYDIANFITPSVGYYYGLVSTDNKELNGYSMPVNGRFALYFLTKQLVQKWLTIRTNL